MKPYMISIYDRNAVRDVMFRNPLKKREYLVFGPSEQRYAAINNLRLPLAVYFADNEQDAVDHAETLAYNNPGCEVVVALATKTISSVPPKESKMIYSNYDKNIGLVPA